MFSQQRSLATAASAFLRTAVFLTAVFSTAIFSTALFLTAGCNARPASSQKEGFPGRALVTQGAYRKAIPVLKGYLQTHPQGKHASRAGLFLGKAHLALGEFNEARAAFQDTVDRFPATLEGHKCRYKLALVELLVGDRGSARQLFRALADQPDGPLWREAAAMADYLQAEP